MRLPSNVQRKGGASAFQAAAKQFDPEEENVWDESSDEYKQADKAGDNAVIAGGVRGSVKKVPLVWL